MENGKNEVSENPVLIPDEQQETSQDIPSPNLSILPPPELVWKKKFLIRLLWLSLIAACLYYSTEGIFVLLILFIAVVPFEKLFPRHKGQKIRRPHLHLQARHLERAPEAV